MKEIFTLQVAWWEIPLRATLIYISLLVLVRASGKRTVGKFTPFDLMVVMLMSSSASGALTARDSSITACVLVSTTLIALNVLTAFASSRSVKLKSVLEGNATLIGRNGVIYEGVLNKFRIPVDDVYEALRQSDCALPKMKCAFLEVSGEISILKSTDEEHSAE